MNSHTGLQNTPKSKRFSESQRFIPWLRTLPIFWPHKATPPPFAIPPPLGGNHLAPLAQPGSDKTKGW